MKITLLLTKNVLLQFVFHLDSMRAFIMQEVLNTLTMRMAFDPLISEICLESSNIKDLHVTF